MPTRSESPSAVRSVPPVVGVGASAGGLDALVRFFAAVPRRSGLAYVVVQHLSPDHKSLMPELLARHTELPVVRAQDQTPIEADTIYLMPAQQDMTLTDGCLRMHGRQEGGVHHPIDHFLASLAANLGSRAVGVVLSGTGRDGTQGAIALHAAGGLVVAQDPTTAGFDGMPASVIESGITDLVLAPEDIPPAILRTVEGSEYASTEQEREVSALRGIIGTLSRISAVDFGEYKTATLLRRAQRRAHELGLETLDEYAVYAGDTPTEAERLRREVLVGVSSFFRDANTFGVLANVVLPELIGSERFDGTLRGWSMACSTGQEPYSIGMLIAEEAERSQTAVRAKIFASDVDRLAVDFAAHGRYRDDAIEHVDPTRLARFFRQTANGWQVDPSLRQSVVFSVHNALRDPPFSRLDLLCCRNFLIYLRPNAQRKVLTRCLMALKPGGFLVLGSSESLGDLSDAFDVVDARARVYRRREGAVAPQFLAAGVFDGPQSPRTIVSAPEPRRVVEEAYRTLALLDSPLSLVVTSSNSIVHTTGSIDEYFSLPIGQPTMDATRMARGTLAMLLTAALGKSRHEAKVIEYRAIEIRLRDEDQPVRIDLRVAPTSARVSEYHVISIRRVEAAPLPAGEATSLETIDADHYDLLRHELDATREHLQSAIEELETANEELQAANEELVASNEELQATNEEVQATNEELLSANAEGERRIQDLVELNADIDNLLRSTDIGTLFLDEHLAIRKFTPLVCEFISLLDRDVGRPIAHVRHTLMDLDLPECAMRVIREGCRIDTPATDGQRHVLLRAVPYRLEGQTRGVVISFVDVTELAATRAELEAVMDALPEQIAVLDHSGKITRVNRSWRSFGEANGIDPAWNPIGVDYLGIVERAVREAPEVTPAADGIRRVLTHGATDFSLEYRCDSPSEERHFYMHASAPANGGIVISHVDVTPVARAARELEQSVAVYRRLFAINREPLLLVDPRTMQVVESNGAATEALGRSPEEFPSLVLGQVLEPEAGGWDPLFHGALHQGIVEDVRARVLPDDGAQIVAVTLHAIEARASKLVLVCMRAPRSELQPDEREALRSRSTQAQKMEALGRLAGGVAHELNNVLTAILAVSSVRRQELPADDPVAKDLDSVVTACGRGADLTRNLLGFARQGRVAREPFDLAEAAREVIGLVAKSIPARVTIAMRAKQPVTVSGDRSQIAQALMNLCMNACDAIRGTGSVGVEVGIEPGGPHRGADTQFAVMRVTDDGVGMDELTRQHAFEPFFTTKPRGEGSGLGLSMVYGVAQSHGGWVEISSRLGAGTTVELALPAAATARSVKSSTPIVERGNGALVLVVDDDEMVRGPIARLLARQDYTVEAVAGGREAIERIRSRDARPVDIVLLDISMPDLDGLAALEQIRQSHPGLPVLLYSGYPDRVPQRMLDVDQRTGFCTKPVEIHRLTAQLNLLLRDVQPRSA
jgi:two-component system CheB/CheR fusion protein